MSLRRILSTIFSQFMEKNERAFLGSLWRGEGGKKLHEFSERIFSSRMLPNRELSECDKVMWLLAASDISSRKVSRLLHGAKEFIL